MCKKDNHLAIKGEDQTEKIPHFVGQQLCD